MRALYWRLISSERKARAKLVLSRRVDRIRDQSKRKTLLHRANDVGNAWIPELRGVGDVVRGDIEAQRHGFADFEILIKGKIQVACPFGANVIKVVRSVSRNERVWIGRLGQSRRRAE